MRRDMPVDEIRTLLGYRSFDEFAADRIKLNEGRLPQLLGSGEARRRKYTRTGRTTRILCTALSVASFGRKVCVYGVRDWHTKNIQRRIYDLARDLGMSLDNIVFGPPRHGAEDITFLSDHGPYNRD